MGHLQSEVGQLDRQCVGGCKRGESRIAELGHGIWKMRNSTMELGKGEPGKLIRTTDERLKRTEELLSLRPTEVSEEHTFLSTKDRLSLVEMLSTVPDLSENLYQVAVQRNGRNLGRH